MKKILNIALIWLKNICWRQIFTGFVVLIPVFICFAISAGIEIIVFRSVFTVLGFQEVAVFLALSLELFKLIIPVLLTHGNGASNGVYNGTVIMLRFVLFFISFCCTFVAVANNLVDTNVESVEAKNTQIIQQAVSEFNSEYQQKRDAVNEIADKQIEEKKDSYDLDSKQKQLERLNETYAANHDWATYSLILEINASITQAQNALNEEINSIEQDRAAKLSGLEQQYSDEKLREKTSEAVKQGNTRKYDLTQNTNITKVIYLIRSTFGVEMSYEWVTVFMALLICFSSECIIWTGSVFLVRRINNRPPPEDPFEQELKKRLDLNHDSAGSLSTFSMVARDRRLMKRLSAIERRNLAYHLSLMEHEKKNQFIQNKKELKSQRRLNRRRMRLEKRLKLNREQDSDFSSIESL